MTNSDTYIMPGLKSIDECVAEAFCVTVKQLKASNRKGPGKDARFFAMWWRKKYTIHTEKEIGAMYSGRDHSSVNHASKKADEWMEVDRIYNEMAQEALRLIGATKIDDHE